MRLIIRILVSVVFVLAGLFFYLPPVLGIPCLGWYRDLLVVVKGTLPAAAILFGLVFIASAK